MASSIVLKGLAAQAMQHPLTKGTAGRVTAAQQRGVEFDGPGPDADIAHPDKGRKRLRPMRSLGSVCAKTGPEALAATMGQVIEVVVAKTAERAL